MTGRRVAVVITKLEGGAGVLALRGSQAVMGSGFRPVIVTGRGGRLLDEARALGVEVAVVPSLVTPVSPGTDTRALRALTALLRRRRFDVVHTHTAKAGTLGRIAARRAGAARIVHTYHGFWFHEFQRPATRAAYVAAERALGRVTDVALCVGTGVAVEAVRRRLIAPERIRTMGVAVPGGPERCAATREKARRALGLAPDAIVVGTVGRLTYQKAPEDFVAALRLLARGRPNVTGVWIGGGDQYGAVRELAARPGTPPVVLAGDRGDVPDLLPAFDVFALTSRYEGLPTVIVEAMTCGIPVVATAVNAVGDLVVPGETGLLVPPRRPDLLASAAGHLLDRPRDADRMAAAARARLGRRFSPDSVGEVLASAYAGAVRRQAAAPGAGAAARLPATGRGTRRAHGRAAPRTPRAGPRAHRRRGPCCRGSRSRQAGSRRPPRSRRCARCGPLSPRRPGTGQSPWDTPFRSR